jgi:dihydrofolate reductase
MKDILLIVAVDDKYGFAKENAIPWKIKEDLQHFQRLTTSTQNKNLQNAVIMGRQTFLSLNQKPLKNRLNIVLTSQKFNNVFCAASLKNAIDYCMIDEEIESIFIIGGENVYSEALRDYPIRIIYKTHVQGDFSCDKFIAPFNNHELYCYTHWKQENEYIYRYESWKMRET